MNFCLLQTSLFSDDPVQTMSEKLFSLCQLISELLQNNPLYTPQDLNRMAKNYAKENAKISDSGDVFLPVNDCYEALCKVQIGHSREVIRTLCEKHGIPVPPLKPQGAIYVAMEQYDLSNNENLSEESRLHNRRCALEWFCRAVNLHDFFWGAASAGYIITLFRQSSKTSEADNSQCVLWNDRPQCKYAIDFVVCSALRFYCDVVTHAVLYHPCLIEFAKNTVKEFLLAACNLSRLGCVYLYNNAKYFLVEVEKTLFYEAPYLASMLLAFVSIEHYQRCSNASTSLTAIRNAACYYNRPEWVDFAEKKCAKNLQLAREHIERAERQEEEVSFDN